MNTARDPPSTGSRARVRVTLTTRVMYDHIRPLYDKLGASVEIIKEIEGQLVAMHGRIPEQERARLTVEYRRILLSHGEAILQRREPLGDIVKEMQDVIRDHNQIVNGLYPMSETPEAKVYCLTMTADFHRLMWSRLKDIPEYSSEASVDWNTAKTAYATASRWAREMSPINPLGLAALLSFAKFKRDLFPKESLEILKNARDRSVSYITDHPEDIPTSDSHRELEKIEVQIMAWDPPVSNS